MNPQTGPTPCRRVATGAVWEDVVGYSRALRVGNQVFVTGTIGIGEDGNVVSPGDGYEQTRRALQIIGNALEQLGANFTHVVRTRIYVTDISKWEEIGRAHREVFDAVRPCATMVEVTRLAAEGAVVEIEADAVVD